MIDLSVLRQMVESEIETYKYEVPEGSVGNPWPTKKCAPLSLILTGQT